MPLDIARIRAVLFDVDGTLSDSDDHVVARLAEALPGHSVKTARRIVMALESPGNWLFGALDMLHLDAPLMRVMDAVSRSRLGRQRVHGAPVPGVPDMLERLSVRYHLAVVSARWEYPVKTFLGGNGLSGRFTCVATALTCRHTKPYPDPILWAAAQLGVAPSACLMVGDTTVDMRSGKRAGAQCCGVLCGFGTEAELRRAGADIILNSTADLAAALAA